MRDDDARRRDDLARAYLVEEVRSTLRHSLRNRLSVVRSAAYYLRRKVEATPLFQADPNVQRFFELIDREVTTACDLLGSSELDDGRPPVPVDPATAAQTALRDVDPPSDVKVAVALDGVSLVATDADDLAVALGCLLEHAVDAAVARGGGEVRIESRRDADGQVAIAVIDEGAGVAQETQAQATAGHQALGLSIARRIALRWGGTLQVDAVAGGVQTTLRLPPAS